MQGCGVEPRGSDFNVADEFEKDRSCWTTVKPISDEFEGLERVFR